MRVGKSSLCYGGAGDAGDAGDAELDLGNAGNAGGNLCEQRFPPDPLPKTFYVYFLVWQFRVVRNPLVCGARVN
jgi:hypothetical protein